MKQIQFFVLLLIILACGNKENAVQETGITAEDTEQIASYAMVIHGGAGTILKENMTEENEKAYLDILTLVLKNGEKMLIDGASAEEVVVSSIKIMEDSPLFNAGKGAVFNHEGQNEMDASIMRGVDQSAGAVSGVTNVKNPITAAQKVMNESEHVLLSGKGAEEFAALKNCEIVQPSYFYTEDRMKSLEEAKMNNSQGARFENVDWKYGTVGCVVLDKKGNIVAGTSTGGMTNKRYNRIGDSPIIGAGTYADNATCGVSATGHGEYFIRYAVAHDISARMEYKEISLQEAADEVVMSKLVEKGGAGGVIALDRAGNIAMPFNTPGMYRGYVKEGELVVKIYKD